MANVSPPIAKRLFEWSLKHISDDLLVLKEDIKGREDEPHITVKFGLLERTPSEKLLEIIKNTRPISVKIGNISLFKNGKEKGFDVVKCEVVSESLHELNKLISETCKNEDEYKTYHPHLTVAYVKPDSCNHLNGLNPLGNLNEFVINEVVFAGSGDDNKKRVKQIIKLYDISYKTHFEK